MKVCWIFVILRKWKFQNDYRKGLILSVWRFLFGVSWIKILAKSLKKFFKLPFSCANTIKNCIKSTNISHTKVCFAIIFHLNRYQFITHLLKACNSIPIETTFPPNTRDKLKRNTLTIHWLFSTAINYSVPLNWCSFFKIIIENETINSTCYMHTSFQKSHQHINEKKSFSHEQAEKTKQTKNMFLINYSYQTDKINVQSCFSFSNENVTILLFSVMNCPPFKRSSSVFFLSQGHKTFMLIFWESIFLCFVYTSTRFFRYSLNQNLKKSLLVQT